MGCEKRGEKITKMKIKINSDRKTAVMRRAIYFFFFSRGNENGSMWR